MLLLCTAIFSTEDTGNVPEYERKTWELNQLAERFKAETGFVGEVGHSTNTMRLHTYRGNFSGIYFSSEGDTIAFRQACEMIVEKILPFSPANRMQLSMSRISKSVRGYTTDYIQQVDGYGVEGAGFIMITCDSGRKHFSIGDNTVELPDGVNVQISKEEAFQIARSEFEKSPLCNKDTPPWRHKSLIQFKSRKIGDVQLPYRLKWQIVFPGIVYYIDAETGEWFCEGYVINQQTACEVMGSKFNKDSNFSSLGLQAMKSIEVLNDDHDPYYTNDSGIALLDGYPSEWFQVNYQSDRYSVRTKSNPSCLSYNVFTQTPTGINVVLPDSLYCSTDSIYYAQHTPNILHHIKEQDSVFCSIVESFENCLYPQIVADCDIPVLGLWDPRLGEIQLREGKNSHVIRHEASHYFTFNIMGFHQFFETTNPDVTNPNFAMPYQAMDEAFAEYWLSIGIDSTYHNHGIANDIAGYDVASINQLYYDGSLAINESFYTNYWNRYPLASVWWSLRGSSLFPNSDQGVVGVDTLLVAGLKIVNEEIIPNSSYRYKPRYFYNILMNLVADGSAPNTLNPKQAAIDNAYKSRGFHFTPQVISAGVSNPPDGRDKNMFRIGDPVHVKVTNCPQNTPFTVYIVEDQDYTDGMNISALNTIICQVSGTSDNDGVWYSSTPVMTATTVGDYDILVDIGNNGVLHFAYIGANVRDGFDGLDGSGFTVYDDGIDVVVALDNSGSMAGVSGNLQRTARALIGYLYNGDRVNMFKFSSINLQNYVTNLVGNNTSLITIENNQDILMNSVSACNTNHNTNLNVPFNSGYQRFTPPLRNRGLILFSDGLHDSGIAPNNIQNLINAYYQPNIKCHSMCYTTQTTYADMSMHNMSKIAQWGDGFLPFW